MAKTTDGKSPGDAIQGEMIDAVERYRRLEGERIFNHFLRNMLDQSNKVLRDLGLIVADDQRIADLETQLQKARSEASAAAAYANYFGLVLKNMSTGSTDKATAEKAKKALEWTPQQGEAAGEAPRATH